MKLKGKKVVFLGDSITEGTGTSCEAARFTCLLEKNAGLAPIKNYSIGGTRIARQQHIDPQHFIWDTNSFAERFHKMDNEADIVVVFGGTNDFDHGDAPFGTDDDRTMDTYCGALHYLMQGLIEKYPMATICFLTPLHRRGENVPNASNKLLFKPYVDQIKKTAQLYSLPVLDLYANAGIQPAIQAQKELFIPDGLHPNDLGNQRIAERLQAFLEAL